MSAASRSGRRGLARIAAAAVLLALSSASTAQSSTTTTQLPAGDQVTVGGIEIDKPAGRFVVKGEFVDLGSPDAPVEFLIGTRDSVKLYETLIRADTDAVDFNVACILIGLDPANGRAARYHFDPEPVAGDAVRISVTWEEAGRSVTRSAASLLHTPGADAAPADEFVYTGSMFAPDGQFMAQANGVLVGVVHAPETLIEHRTGLGLGNYGGVLQAAGTLPPPGTPVRIEVERVKATP